jgi:hypothetical protein
VATELILHSSHWAVYAGHAPLTFTKRCFVSYAGFAIVEWVGQRFAEITLPRRDSKTLLRNRLIVSESAEPIIFLLAIAMVCLHISAKKSQKLTCSTP